MMLYEMITGLPPWYSKHRPTLFERILRAPLYFPPIVSQEAKAVIRGLLRRAPRYKTFVLLVLLCINMMSDLLASLC